MNDSILQALYRAILEEPFLDLHRLAYADRCEELGKHGEARFIREQLRTGKEFGTGNKEICRRGFLEEIHLRCSQFMEKAKDYFLHHPILVVRLIDRKPQDNSDYHPHPWDDRCVVSWHRIVPDYGTESDDLPISLWEHLRGTTENRYKFYSSVESANEALSHACVAYGRKLAGLPPL